MKRATDAEGGSIERKRGAYEKITPESKAKIAKYAAENGIAAAIRHFENNQAFPNLKESTVRGWKKAYCASGAAETTPDKYTKASAKHRYGEVAKRSTDTVKSPSEAQIR